MCFGVMSMCGSLCQGNTFDHLQHKVLLSGELARDERDRAGDMFGTVNSDQCRAARALLRWTTHDLADRSGVGRSTILNFEADRTLPRRATIRALKTSFEEAGVEFTNGDRPGVRMPAK